MPSEATPHLVVIILDREVRHDDVLHALAQRGHGATFINSLGLGRLRREMRMGDVPLIASLSRLLEQPKEQSILLLCTVPDEAGVEEVIGAVQEVVGDLDHPNTGMAFAIPITHLTGYQKYDPKQLTG